MTDVSTLTALAVRPGETQPRVSSLQIAEAFERNHKNLLRDIRSLMANCPLEFTGANFEPVEYLDPKGEYRPQFLLTRDAFSLLAMGFTGPRALQWKVRYIEAFNQMERELLASSALPCASAGLPAPASGEDEIARRFIMEGLRLADRLTPERRRAMHKAAHYRSLGLSFEDVGKLVGCGATKAQQLVSDAAILKGGSVPAVIPIPRQGVPGPRAAGRGDRK